MGLFTVQNPDFSTPYVHQMSFSVQKALPAGIVVTKSPMSANWLTISDEWNRRTRPFTFPDSPPRPIPIARRILLPGIYSCFVKSTRILIPPTTPYKISREPPVQQWVYFPDRVHLGQDDRLLLRADARQYASGPYNHRADRSRSDEDRQHVFATSFVYEIPAWKNQKGILGQAFGAWALSGVVSIARGTPSGCAPVRTIP